MPSEFGRMTSLRELNKFVVGRRNGIDALAGLNLRGELTVDFLRWRRDAVAEARRVNLKDIHQLTGLALNFRFKQKASHPTEVESFLECLQIPPNVKTLEIKGYNGEKFPQMMVDKLPLLVPMLVHVTVMDCKKCRVLPLFSQLSHLKSLRLWGLSALDFIDNDLQDNVRESSSATYFPSLLTLNLCLTPELKRWAKMETDPQNPDYKPPKPRLLLFPRLSSLNILQCPKLLSMPSVPMLKKLFVVDVDEKLLRSLLTVQQQNEPSSSSCAPSALQSLRLTDIHRMTSFSINFHQLEILTIDFCKEMTTLIVESPNLSIRRLRIQDCPRLRSLCDGLQHLSALEELTVGNCEELDLWNNNARCLGLKRLSYLRISSISKLVTLPANICDLSSLQRLVISDLHNLTALPEQIGQLSQLCELRILECPKLGSLPSSFRNLTSLQELTIYRCPELEMRCQQHTGQDWTRIQHVPLVSHSKYQHPPFTF